MAFGIAAYLEMLRGVTSSGQHYSTAEPAYAQAQQALIHSDDYAAGLKLPAFDAWRDLDSHALDHQVVELRKTIRSQGVLAALATLPA